MIHQNTWRFQQLFFAHLLAALLLGSLLWPATHSYWQALDIPFFKWINHSLEGNPGWQLFWACANHKLADWVEDLFILGFWIVYICSKRKGERTRGVAEFIFSALCIAAILFFVNRMLFREHLQIPRESPTLVVDSSIRLSDQITWMKIKDDSVCSFPGDHATTALLFAATLSHFANHWRTRFFAWLYAAFLCMPRLITGAHWLSDVLVGSGSIVLFCLSWAFFTPFHRWAIDGIASFLSLFKRRRQAAEETA